jgi:hypothetical protein
MPVQLYKYTFRKGQWAFGIDKTPDRLYIHFWRWCWSFYEDDL